MAWQRSIGSACWTAPKRATTGDGKKPSLFAELDVATSNKSAPQKNDRPNLRRRNDAVFFPHEGIFGLTFLLLPAFLRVYQSVCRTCGAIAPQIFVSQNENEVNGASPRFLP
jgi:hypothetical protein